jgi:hypothetical protein
MSCRAHVLSEIALPGLPSTLGCYSLVILLMMINVYLTHAGH